MCMLAGCGRPDSKSEFPGNAAKPGFSVGKTTDNSNVDVPCSNGFNRC